MVNKVIPGECRIGNHLQRWRRQSGLSKIQLAEMSRVSCRFICAAERGRLADLISKRLIEQVVAGQGEISVERVMRHTLVRWADQLRRLANALAADFEEVFPDEYLADTCDQLWRRVGLIRQLRAELQPAPCRDFADNPWHDWGWFTEEPLSEDLVDDDLEQILEQHELVQIIQSLLADLPRPDQSVLARRYGLFDGVTYTQREVGLQLGLTVQRVQQIEERALRRLRHPYRSRQLRDYWERE